MSSTTAKTKFSVHVQSGWLCHNCTGMSVVDGLDAPIECGNCGHKEFKLAWKQKIKTTTTVESL